MLERTIHIAAFVLMLAGVVFIALQNVKIASLVVQQSELMLQLHRNMP
jgi:hypothetical protein